MDGDASPNQDVIIISIQREHITMRTTRQSRLLLQTLLITGLAMAASMLPGRVWAAEEDVSQNDPPRWYQLDDTPALHYRNLLKEARAAYTQARQECNMLTDATKISCRKDARQHYQDDKARAKRILKLLSNQ